MKDFAITELRGVVDAVADVFDPSLLDMFNAEKAILEWGAIEKRAAAMKLKAAARADDLGLDAERAVADASGVTTSAARRQTKIRKKLAKTPKTQAAFDSGAVSTTEANAIADAIEVNPAAEDALLELAASGSTCDVLGECDRVRRDALDADGGLAARQREARKLRHWKNGLGNVCGMFEFEPVFGAKFVAELERGADRKFRAQVQAKGGSTRKNSAWRTRSKTSSTPAIPEPPPAGTANRGGAGPAPRSISSEPKPPWTAATSCPVRNAKPPTANRSR